MDASLRLIPIAVLILVISGADIVQAADPVCSDTPASDERVFCFVTDSTEDISIDLDDVILNTTEGGESNVHGQHITGTGDIVIDVQDSSLTTTGADSHSIHGYHAGTGGVQITVMGSTLTTMGNLSRGIWGYQRVGMGNVDIDVVDSTILTKGYESYAVFGWHTENSTQQDDIDIDVQGGSLTTQGLSSNAIYGRHQGNGNVNITAVNAIITTESTALGPTTNNTFSLGLYGLHQGMGDIDITARGTSITTKGHTSHGILGYQLAGMGNVYIDLDDSSVMAEGENSNGIFVLNNAGGEGTVDIRLINNSTVTTMADTAPAVYAAQLGSGSVDILIDEGSTVIANGTNANAVQVGRLSSDGAVERSAEVGEDGYRKQTVTVNGSVTGGASGVYLAGGGRVVIGPQGSIASESGIAILATGTVPEVPEDNTDPNNVIPAIPAIQPKLWVDLNLGGRRVAQVIGDDWIINDGGETTIAVNRTVLHDGATGVTGRTAVNGAWNVRMVAEGVTVDDRADPANWMISEPAIDIISDRDFSVADFTETRRPVPPPPSCPDGQVGTPPDCTDAETDTDTDTEMPMFMEEYAPRAALYESLPGFLLRLADRGRLNHRPVSPVWMVFSGGNGSVDPSRSTTGAEYDYDRYRVQLGKSLSFGEGLEGWFAVHYTQGDSEVSSPTGGGDIDAEGTGAAFDLQSQHTSGYYLGAHASFTSYDVDLSSDDIGRLRSSVDALGTSLGFEAGRQMAIGETFQMTPRAWLSHSSIDIDSFTDAVDAQASFPDEVRLTGGFGALAETMQPWKGGELTWHGSLDLERRLNSRSTRVDVSGEQLKTETVSTRMLLGLGSLYQKGGFSISAQVSIDGLGAYDEEYSGQVNIGVRL